jgi:serine/threonine protein kinase
VHALNFTVKAANVMVTTTGTIKLVDFGHARRLVDSPPSRTVGGDDGGGAYVARADDDFVKKMTTCGTPETMYVTHH